MDEICLETESLWKLLAELRMDAIVKNGEPEAVTVVVVTVEVETAAEVVVAIAEVVTGPFGWTSTDPQPVQISELLWKISPAESAGRI